MKKLNGIREWALFIFTAVGIIASICLAYQALNDRVGITEKTVAEVRIDVKLHNTAIVKMETKLENIAEDTKDIKSDIKDIRDALTP